MAPIDAVKVHHHYKPGQFVFYAGNQSTGVYCLLKGNIKLEMESDTGKTQIIQVAAAGGVIGYRSLFTDEPHLCSAIAVDAVEVCFIPKKPLLDFLETQPKVAMNFLSKVSKEFRVIETRLQHATTHTAPERIAEALLFLRENFDDKNWTRKEIADWAGTTPETVIRTLGDLEAEGVITQKGRGIQIIHRKELLNRAKIAV
jgi:CRP-like cAMP-binding protein